MTVQKLTKDEQPQSSQMTAVTERGECPHTPRRGLGKNKCCRAFYIKLNQFFTWMTSLGTPVRATSEAARHRHQIKSPIATSFNEVGRDSGCEFEHGFSWDLD